MLKNDSPSLHKAYKKLIELYNKIPPIPCNCCGMCCTSPHITFIEFCYLFENLLKQYSINQIKNILEQKPEFHNIHTGNLYCKFQKNNKCSIHKFRPLICRLYGFPIINRVYTNIENCNQDRGILPEFKDDALENALQTLENINSQFYEFNSEPFYLTGLNIECWVSIMFGERIDYHPFKKLREYFHKFINAKAISILYKDEIKFNLLIEKIVTGYNLIGENREKAKSIFKEIAESTNTIYGWYFKKEAIEIVKSL